MHVKKGEWPILCYAFLFIFSQLCQFSLQKGRQSSEFDFGCIKVTAEASVRNNGKNSLDVASVEQKGGGQKKLKGKVIAKKQMHGLVMSSANASGYPGSGFVNEKCAVELEATIRSGLVLQITFDDVDLEPRYSRSAQCLREYLVLTIIDKDGREHTSERICGNEKPEPVRSMQSKARVLFVASSPSQLGNLTSVKRRRGFKLRYEFVVEATILAPSSVYFDMDTRFRSECGGVNSPTALSGEIHSPGFPFTYPKNVTCYWLLRVAAHRRLYVRILDLELSPTVAECDRASLHLLDGYRHDIPQNKGEDESWATAIVSSTGGKRRTGAKGGGGEAADADFCGSSQYFGEEGMKSYLSDGNRVLVKFTTRDGPSHEQMVNYRKWRTPIGFRLLWTEVESLVATSSDVLAEEGDPEHPSIIMADQCPGFVCLGGTFCVDTLDSVCIERTRLCINETLRCDGVANCAENDDSDEAYCYSHNPVSFSAFALLFVALILFLLLATFCTLRHFNRPKMVTRRQQKRRLKRLEEAEKQEKNDWQRRRSERMSSGGDGERTTRRPMEVVGRRQQERRRLSDTRMRKLRIPSVSSAVEEREVRTKVILATPPILGQQHQNGVWKVDLNINNGNIPDERRHNFDENNNNGDGNDGVEGERELPCLCPIRNGGAIPPKVRIYSRDDLHQRWVGDGDIWERRRSAMAMDEMTNGKGILESLS